MEDACILGGCCCCYCIRQTEVGIVEQFGQFRDVKPAGLAWWVVFPPFWSLFVAFTCGGVIELFLE